MVCEHADYWFHEVAGRVAGTVFQSRSFCLETQP